MMRRPRLTDVGRLIGVQTQQSGEQPNRPFPNVLRECLKLRAEQWRVKQGRLRDS